MDFYSMSQISKLTGYSTKRLKQLYNLGQLPDKYDEGFKREELEEWYRIYKKLDLWCRKDIIEYTGLCNKIINEYIRNKCISQFKPKFRDYGKERFIPDQVKLWFEQYQEELSSKNISVVNPIKKVNKFPQNGLPQLTIFDPSYKHEPMLSLKEVAILANKNVSIAAYWKRKGYIKPAGEVCTFWKGFIKFRKKHLFRKSDIIKFLKEKNLLD